MSYEIKLSKNAETDIRELYEYIAFHLSEENIAAKTVYRISENFHTISEIPEGFRRYEKEPWKSRGLRVMPVDNYVILYIPREDIKTVEIIRVLYGGMNIDAQLERTEY